MLHRQLFKRRRAFRKQNQLQRIVGPIRQRDLHGYHSYLFCGFERCTVHVCCRIFLHPGREVSDAQSLHVCTSVKIQFAWDTVYISGIRPGNCLQHQQRVFHTSRHRSEFVQGPAQGHRAGPCYAAIRWSQPGHSAAHAWRHNASACLAPDRKSDKSRRGSGSRPGARTRGAFLPKPWIHRLPAEPDIVQRQCSQAEFRYKHRSRFIQFPHHSRIRLGYAVAKRLRSIRCGNSCCVEQVFSAPRNSVQRSAIFSRRNFRVRFLRVGHRVFARKSDHAPQCGIEFLEPLQINIRQPFRTEFLRLNPSR